jgi:alpha-amylase
VDSYFWTVRAFLSPSGIVSELVDGLDKLRGAAQDLSLYGSFLENHDVERFPSLTQDMVRRLDISCYRFYRAD